MTTATITAPHDGAVNDLETLKHIQVGPGTPGKPGLCGVVNTSGNTRGMYRPGAGRRVCAECERLAAERWS